MASEKVMRRRVVPKTNLLEEPETIYQPIIVPRSIPLIRYRRCIPPQPRLDPQRR